MDWTIPYRRCTTSDCKYLFKLNMESYYAMQNKNYNFYTKSYITAWVWKSGMEARFRRFSFLMLLGLLCSCNYLDIVPDNIATVDNAFKLRSQAEKYLFTCYSYIPNHASTGNNPALLSGDEVWFYYPYKNIPNFQPPSNWEIARDNQNILDPYLNFWDGLNGGISMFQWIRDCNIFLDNIHQVPDISPVERKRWIAEVLFLKAYYHWFLLRMYGPIPICDQNLPVSSDIAEVQVERKPVDDCFDYIVALLDSAAHNLPDNIINPVSEMGRITRPIVLSIKARI